MVASRYNVVGIILILGGITCAQVNSKKEPQQIDKKGYEAFKKQDLATSWQQYEQVQFYNTERLDLSKDFEVKNPVKDFETSEQGDLIIDQSIHTREINVPKNSPLILRRAKESIILKGLLYSSKLPSLARGTYEVILKEGLFKIYFSRYKYILYSLLKPVYPNDFEVDIFPEDQYGNLFVPIRISPLAVNFEQNKQVAETCKFYVIIGNDQTYSEDLYCLDKVEAAKSDWNFLKYKREFRKEFTSERETYKGVPIENIQK